jgi:hypothetical protein
MSVAGCQALSGIRLSALDIALVRGTDTVNRAWALRSAASSATA